MILSVLKIQLTCVLVSDVSLVFLEIYLQNIDTTKL